jgi:hypothetical protein
MTYTECETRVREIVGDTSAVVSSCIAEAVKFLERFSSLEAWDETKSTVANQEYIETPAGTIDVEVIYVNGLEMKKLADDDFIRVPAYKDAGVERFYLVKTGIVPRIYFTVTPTAVATVKMLIKKQYAIPTGASTFDFPRHFDELVIFGAVVRYYQMALSNVMKNRELFPDVNPDEINKSLKNAQDYFSNLLSGIRQ